MKINLKGNWDTREVFLDGERLDPKPSQQIMNHSPDGFNWGYGGSGPAQLALAVCLKLWNKDTAVKVYQTFKNVYICRLPQKDFDENLNVPLITV